MTRCRQCESRLRSGALYCASCGARRADDDSALQIDDGGLHAPRGSVAPVASEGASEGLRTTGLGATGAMGLGGPGLGAVAGPHRAKPSQPLLLDRPLIGLGGAPATEASARGRLAGRDGLAGLDGLERLGVADNLGVVEVGGGSPGGRKRRAMAFGVGVVVVVGALAVLSRGGDQATGDDAKTPTATTTARPRTNTTIPVAPLTTTPTPTTAVRVLGPLLPAPSGVSLVFVGSGGAVQRADLDTGRIETLPIEIGNDGGHQLMSLGGDAMAVMDFSGGRGPGVAIYPAGGGDPVYVAGQQFWRSTTPGRVWILANNFGDSVEPVGLKELDSAGVVRRSLTLPDGVGWAFPVGDAIFMSVAGGVYRFDPQTSTSTLVAYGEIRSSFGDGSAVPPDRVDMFVCDDKLVCAIKTFDATGEQIASRPPDSSSSNAGSSGEVASPDGKYRATFDYETSRVSILDSRGTSLWESPGRFRSGFSLMNGASSLRWSNDSKWLFLQSSDGLKAWTTGRSELIDIPLGNVGAFDVVAEP
jgi:hypothetical protein